MASNKRPIVFGVLLCLLGIALSIGGLRILSMGATDLYFLVVGIGVAAAGGLIAAGRLLGAWLYLLVLLVMAVWSFAQVGPDISALLPRLALPTIFAAYMFSARVRPLLR